MHYKYSWGECNEKMSKGDIEAVQMIYGQPFACNFDPKQKAEGPNFQCIDCWGENTDIAICFFCKINHHQNHKVFKHERDIYFCDCGRFEHKLNLCTRILTNSENKVCKQNFYECLSCKLEADDYLCISCVKNCHIGHETVMIKKKVGECKCSCSGINCKVNVVKDTFSNSYCKLI